MKPLTLNEIITAIRARNLGAPPGATVIERVSVDTRDLTGGELFVARRGAEHDAHAWVGEAFDKGAVAAIVDRIEALPAPLRPSGGSPASRPLLVVEDSTAALGRLGAYHRRQLPATVIAVTGSCGKTTAKAMIDCVLSGRRRGRAAPRSFNNAVGVPLTLLAADGSDQYLVVEIGSNAPGEVDALAALTEPDIAVVTGVWPTHLAGFGDLGGVAAEKASLLRHVRRGGMAAYNADQPILASHLAALDPGTMVVRFGLREQADLRAANIESTAVETDDGLRGRLRFVVNDHDAFELPVLGRHHVINALAAIAVGRRLAMSMEQIAERLAGFETPAMRGRIETLGSILLIDDSYNASPASVTAAAAMLCDIPRRRPTGIGRRVMIVGDMKELGPASAGLHARTGAELAAMDLDLLLVVGYAAKPLAVEARKTARFEVRGAPNVGLAAGLVQRQLRPNDIVLIKASRAMRLERLREPIARSG